jgi:peptide chain release factor 2
MRFGGFFDLKGKEERLSELEAASQEPEFWKVNTKAEEILRELNQIKESLKSRDNLDSKLSDIEAILLLLQEEEEPSLRQELKALFTEVDGMVSALEIKTRLSGTYDKEAAILEINGGAGGTDAQDWAEMLLRMYVRYAENEGFVVEELDYQEGEAAGIKSVTLLISGPFAYGYLRGEQGVHRLVRLSPFNSDAKRHTSFASVSVTPDIEERVHIDIDEKDLRVDTYRSSGAGGQHVNKTDSAVRLTHLPSGIVVACQNERSQHKNRATAMKLLKSKLHELETRKQESKIKEIKGEQMKIDFGSQIRSYVLHPYRLVKDLRSGYETSAVDDILDGNLSPMITAYLSI